jgi:hypothetical protein
MSESVEILISADDQASKKVIDASINMEKGGKRIESILNGLKSPAEKYNEQLEELARLQKEGAITSDQFAQAQEKINQKIQGSGNAFKEVGGKAKSATEFVGVLASLTGNSEIASFTGQLAGMTDKVGQFSEVSKEGGAGAFAFKLGLVSLVGTIAMGLGKAIGNWAFETKKFAEEMEAAKARALELNSALIAMNSAFIGEQREDIELIRDPEGKKAAYSQLLDTLNRDMAAVEGNVRAGEKAVKEWSEAWQITGERKASAEMAIAELANDKARLAELTKQRNELMKITSERAEQNKLIQQENAAKDRSESYLASLREEVELLKATKEERIAIEAARNATEDDRAEAEKLLMERDAILAKQEAERQLEIDRKTAEAERARASEAAIKAAEREAKIKEDAAKKELEEIEAAKQKEEDKRNSEIQRIEDIKKSEMQRLEIQRIEIEQGREAAKIKELMNKGIDKESAKRIAAEEAAIEKLKRMASENEDPQNNVKKSSGITSSLQAAESRLQTRGTVSQQNLMKDLISETKGIRQNSKASLDRLATIDQNLQSTGSLEIIGVV